MEERKSAHRALVETARIFAEEGLPVVRFDYSGCGDSSGRMVDYSIGDWQADVRAVVEFAEKKYSWPKVGLLGVRAGGSIAVRAAEALLVDSLVLWEPVVTGRQYVEAELRKKLVNQMVMFGKSRTKREDMLSELEKGKCIDCDGYPISSRLYEELCGINLSQDEERTAKRIFVIQIGHRDVLGKLKEALEAMGGSVDTEAMVLQPFWSLIGYVNCDELARISAAWFQKGL